MDKIELPIRSVAVTQRLEKTVLEVGVQDLEFIVSQLSAQLIQEQIDLGNPPTSIVVDGSGRRDVRTAKKRVQAFFADKAAIRQAVYEAWNRILNLTRVRTGRAAGAYELWFNDKPVGRTPAAVEMYLDRMVPGKDAFRIVGPVLVYGRKIYWNPKGKPKIKKITVFRGKDVTIKLRRIRGIMDTVEQSMRRRYRYLAITEDWVTTTALPKDGRTPGLYIGFKRRGSLLKP